MTEQRQPTLGSLFDGSGGFPLAGALHGIRPAWASEIEPFPIRVTKLRFPHMKHLGSVTDINGAEIEPVDIITFGSPCQDLSVAGLRKGIHDGERSNLFFEAVRIIKEMREHDRASGRTDLDLRPRFAVWENVPGAFSSNGGEDFRAVLEALCSVGGEHPDIPRPAGGKWQHAGCIVGDGFSIAWRLYDAQYWGVPQRRKRIYLVADFAGERAGEILFERESVPGDTQPGGEAWEAAPADAEGCARRSGEAFSLEGHVIDRQSAQNGRGTPTLKSAPSGGNTIPDVVYPVAADIYNGTLTGDVACTLTAAEAVKNASGPSVVLPINTMVATRGGKDDMRTTFGVGEPGDPQFTPQAAHGHAVAYGFDVYNMAETGDVAKTLSSIASDSDHTTVVFQQNQRDEVRDMGEAAGPLTATLQTKYHYGDGGDAAMVVHPVDYHQQDGRCDILPADSPMPTMSAHAGTGGNNSPMCFCIGNGQTHSLDLRDAVDTLDCMHDQKAVIYPGVGITSAANRNNPAPGDPAPTLTTGCDRDYLVNQDGHRKYILRRLTPTECARLQGFPDWWCDGADGSDSAQYKMWGNGIALPCAADVIGRIKKAMEEDE